MMKFSLRKRIFSNIFAILILLHDVGGAYGGQITKRSSMPNMRRKSNMPEKALAVRSQSGPLPRPDTFHLFDEELNYFERLFPSDYHTETNKK